MKKLISLTLALIMMLTAVPLGTSAASDAAVVGGTGEATSSFSQTLAAQLCTEFREFFPENAVEYFVS